MALNDVFELALRQMIYGITCFNVFHFRDIRGDGDAQHLADDFKNGPALQNWIQLASRQVVFETIATTQIYPFVLNQGGASVHLTANPNNPVSMPPVTAAVITWTTGVRGKRFRGRSYMASTTTSTVGAEWSADTIDRTRGVAAGLYNSYGQDGISPIYRLGVWSRKNGQVDDSTTIASGFTPITGYVARSYVCSMGTRRLGHGI